MQTFTTADAAAIAAQGRTITYLVTFADLAGGPLTADEIDVELQAVDAPAQTSAFGGVAAAQATITLPQKAGEILSPWAGSANSGKLRTGVSVAVQVGGGTTFTIFSGYVKSVKIPSTGQCTVVALDESTKLGSGATVPPAALDTSGGANVAQWGYSPLAAIDLALRSGSRYLTFPPPMSAADRAKYTVLAVSGCGGNIPEIGYLDAPYTIPYTSTAKRIAGVFTPDIIKAVDPASNDQTYLVPTRYPAAVAQTADFVQLDGYCWPEKSNALFRGDYLDLDLNSSGFLMVESTVVSSTNIADGNPHHICVRAVPGLVNIDYFTWIDGVAQTTLHFAAGPTAPESWRMYFAAPWEGLEVMYAPTGSGATAPAPRYGQAADLPSAMTATPTRLSVIEPTSGMTAWQMIQAIASAEGALAWFEGGKFRFEPRTTWNARRVAAPVATYTSANGLGTLTANLDRDGLYGSVVVPYTPTALTEGSVGSPTWLATDVITIKAKKSLTQKVQCDPVPFALDVNDFQPLENMGSFPATQTRTCWYGAVKASSVGDPAAAPVENLQISAVPDPAGITLKIVNPNGFDVALWTKGYFVIPAGPCLGIAFAAIHRGDQRSAIAAANPTVTAVLNVDSNQFMQDATAAQNWATALASDVYAVVPSFDAVTVTGDPRVQIGDLVAVQDTRLMSVPQRALIVGVTHNGSANNAYTMTLQLRAVGAPKSWVLGVAGQSELGTTTILPAA